MDNTYFISGEAVDRLVIFFLPRPDSSTTPGVPKPGESIISTGEEGGGGEPGDVEHPGSALQVAAQVHQMGSAE